MEIPEDPNEPTAQEIKQMAITLLFVALYPGGNSRLKPTTLWNQMQVETKGAFLRRARMALDILRNLEQAKEKRDTTGAVD